MPSEDPVALKESFLEENQLYTEAVLDDESVAIGKLGDIDVAENEIWLLQCPKGMDVKQWQRQKLKIPGRTNFSGSEALAAEFINGKEQHAFAYCNRKEGSYSLRLLPVRGTIVLRNHLKVADTITAERIQECCPPSKRVPMPSNIRIRHPLLGFQFKEKLVLDKDVVDRLHEADQVSAEILRDRLLKKMTKQPKKSASKNGLNATRVLVDSEDDDAEHFVSQEITKSKKTKRTYSESTTTDDPQKSKKKNKKSKITDVNEVSKDLQWLQNI